MNWSTFRRAVPATVAVGLSVAVAVPVARPGLDAAERRELAAPFAFTTHGLNTTLPAHRSERTVAPALGGIRAWISAVGAAVALTDLRGTGRPADLCLVDPRDDSVTVRPAPGGGGAPYPPFTLLPDGLRYDATMAPMGCVPADLDEDGAVDLTVYYWGRSPVIFLNVTEPGRRPAAHGFRAVELVEPMQVWNSTALNVGDIDGSGHVDILVANYFPDGARVLDPEAGDDSRMRMQDGMGMARNAGTNRLFLTTPTGIARSRPQLVDATDTLPADAARSWTLAIGLQDLTGDGMPAVYLANDFGPDQLLVNHSTPGRVRLVNVRGGRDLTTPKSKVLGRDSFKGMGVAFSYTGGADLPMIVVSNITSEWALQESNFAFVPTGPGSGLRTGRLPYEDRSEQLGLSRSGWAWDVKAGDFDNSGTDEFVQAIGFLRGTRDRWAELQELAMGNADLLRYPQAWPKLQPGDDLSGHEDNRFWVRGPDGRYADVAAELGLDRPGVSRGLAVGDVTGDGRLDVAVANQWAESQLMVNRSPAARPAADLRLVVPGASGGTRTAIGAQVVLPEQPTADGQVPRQKYQLYPANGHAGVSAPDVHLALAGTEPVTATVSWRDAAGTHRAQVAVRPGHHTVLLTADGWAVVR